jgi:hypothetical protein
VLNIITIFIFRKKLSRSAFYSLPSFSAKPSGCELTQNLS